MDTDTIQSNQISRRMILPEKNNLVKLQTSEKQENQYILTAGNTSKGFDSQAIRIDLNLDFTASRLKQTLNQLTERGKQLPGKNKDTSQDKNLTAKKQTSSFLKVDLSVDAKRLQKRRVSGKGRRVPREVHFYSYNRKTYIEQRNYRLEQIKLRIQRRQMEEQFSRLSIQYRNGYRTIQQSISQRFHEDLSLQAELMKKFDSTAQNVITKQPESTGKFLKTTDKLVKNVKVSGETITKFFDAVESYIDKTKKVLHKKIDKFLDRIQKDFNIEREKLDTIRANLHSKVDKFFDKVDTMLGQLESESLKELEGDEEKVVQENTAEPLPQLSVPNATMVPAVEHE